MEDLHHDTVLVVPHSTNKVEDPESSPEKKDGADQQQQDNIDDKTLANDEVAGNERFVANSNARRERPPSRYIISSPRLKTMMLRRFPTRKKP